MAKILKNFEFKSFGTDSQHDWDELLDGKIRQLDRGDENDPKDYTCEHQTMRMMLYKQAAKRNMVVQVSNISEANGDDGKPVVTGIVVRARPMTDDEINEAAEKAALKEKAAADKKAAEEKATKDAKAAEDKAAADKAAEKAAKKGAKK